MADEPKIESPEEASRLVHGHAAVSLYGDNERPPIHHQFEGHVSHATSPQQPLVHFVTWESERSCHVDLAGRVVLAGDEKAPVPVRVTHYFEDARCKLDVSPLEVAPLRHSASPDRPVANAPQQLPIHRHSDRPLGAQLDRPVARRVLA